MGTLETKHWAVIGGLLIAIGAQLGGLEHGWHDAVTPGFVGGMLVQIGTTIGAIFVGAPKKPWDGTMRRSEDSQVSASKLAAINKGD